MEKLAIGCGERIYPGFKHLDIINLPHIDYPNTFAHDLFMFENNSVDLIYSSHMLTYYDKEDIETIVLPEWKRVLKPGGKLRLSITNFKALAQAYINYGFPLEKILGPLFGKWENINTGQRNYHKTVFDELTLRKLLTRVGFNDIINYNEFETEHSEIDDHSFAYLSNLGKIRDFKDGIKVSLNVECIK